MTKRQYTLACVSALFASTIFLPACARLNRSPVRASYTQGESFNILVGNEQWRGYVKGDWLPIVYEPPNSKLRIGLDRGDLESNRSESDIFSAVESVIGSLRQYYDDSIEFVRDGIIDTPQGKFDFFLLRASDAQWQLRSLVAFQDSDGRCVFVGFYSDEPTVSKQQAAYYLRKMIGAKIISL